ncbi:MAG: T9SS type A sorting domain-containing protein [Chitinophagales bacterium]|nr:T9SS type A sorting domain-containing protein [Chitinophagales bacterium]
MGNTIFKMMVAALVFAVTSAQAQWTEKGLGVRGEIRGDFWGWSVSMPSANTFASGAYLSDGAATDAGHVRVFSWDGNNWTQKGANIDGKAESSWSGYSVSMPDENTVAIGAPGLSGSTESGYVRIYSWDGSTWVQKGSDLIGDAANDRFGMSVSMPDANTVAIGASENDGGGNGSGQVKIFKWNGTDWEQKGVDFFGSIPSAGMGKSISMPDASTILVGNLKSFILYASVYKWDGSSWVLRGTEQKMSSSGYSSNYSVSMPDANTFAVSNGSIEIYSWDGNDWVQKGASISGDSRVDMPDANTISISDPLDGLPYKGKAAIYRWNGTDWVQSGTDFIGENYDYLGASISMSDNNNIAIGIPSLDGGGTAASARFVRVYSLDNNVGIDKNYFNTKFTITPNPASSYITLTNLLNNTSITITDLAGKQVYSATANTTELSINTSGFANGVYFVNVSNNGAVATKKLVINK